MKKTLYILLILLISVTATHAQLANWGNRGLTSFPTNISGQINGFCRITKLKFHNSNANKMYATTAEGGLFISSDAASNWTVSPGTEVLTGSTASICIDRTNDQVLYLGTGDPNYYNNGQGVYKSTDGGATFTATTLTNCLVIEILQDPSDASTFVAATNKGIYKSNNNGSTWTATTATSIPFCDLKENAATNSPILYACTNENAPRFYRSADFGGSWTQITSGIVSATTFIQTGSRIGVTPADPNVVYLGIIGGGGMILKSNDGGLNFFVKRGEGAGTVALPYITFYDYNNNNGLTGQGNYNNCLWVDVANPAKIWFHSHDNWMSADSGATWTELTHWSTKLHTDMHWVQQSPWDASKLYSCNDGGVWLSTDGGLNWTPKSNGLYAFEVASNAGKCSRTNRDYLIIGTQDNARIYRDGTGWFTITGGDDYENKEYDYLPNGGYYYNKDHNTRTKAPGVSTSTYGLPASKTKWQAIGFNKFSTDLGFLGDTNIYRTTNLSATTPSWTQISTFSKTIMAVHSCLADPNRLYVITSDQKIYVSANALDATPVFTPYTLPSASNTLASIAAVANNAGVVYVSINNKVYRSPDGGATWLNITYNLPSVNHRRILAEEYYGDEELVFIATNNAVYYKKAGQTSWTNYSTNLPGRRAPTDFSIYDDGTNRSLIRYATYGRSVWETAFDNLRPKKAAFFANTTTPCPNMTVQFTDGTVGFTPTTWSWTFPGGTPSTSTAQNPTVSFPLSGTSYDISLTVSDGINVASLTKTAYIVTNSGSALPYSDGVEGSFPPTGWSLSSTGNNWTQNSTIGGFGTSTKCAELVNYATGQNGKKADMISPYVSLTSGSMYGAALSFDVAYAQYNSGSLDSLIVYISTDCGNSYVRLYQKAGDQLKTITPQGSAFTPTAAQWRKETINVSPYIGSLVKFKFRFGSAGGNNIYLDNFNITQTVLTADFSANSTIVPCTGNSVTFSDISTAPLPVTSWNWSFAGGTPSTSASANPTVTYNTAGTYDVTLTVTDGSGHQSSKTLPGYVTVYNYCIADTVPGMAASINGTTNYIVTPAVALGTTNTITLTAWIKITGTQPSFAGIIASASGTATSLNFRSSNQIGYTYNNLASTYNYAGGPTIPTGVWVHVALVTTATNATIYVNGVPYVNNVANSAINFSSGFNLGNDRNTTTRTMTGQMDEVCFYNRALSQNEIRELMHLTKNKPTTDPTLKTYYQFNEVSGSAYDRTGNNINAAFQGTSGRVVSTAPVGTGTSERQTISTNGLKTFTNEGVNLTFGSGTLPNGEICVTRLNIQPDSIPSTTTFENTAGKYWIINNYGTNSTFTSLVNMSLTGYGNISSDDASNPVIFKLNRRNTSDFSAASWSRIDSASAATSGSNGSLTFTGTGNTVFNKQFTVSKESPPFKTLNLVAYLEGLYAGSSTMNAVKDENGLHFGSGIADKITIELHDGSNYSNLIYMVPNVSLSTAGFATTLVPAVYNGSYYITLKHRNSISTVTSSPVSFGPVSISYNFSDNVNKAYGNNLLLMTDGKYAIYAGDANQDDIVDGGDMSAVDNQSAGFASGYLPEDVNGDGLVDGSDLSIVDNNASFFVGVALP